MARRKPKTDWKAIRNAREARERRDVDSLLELLASDDQHVRDTTTRALGLLGDPKAVPELLKQLRSGDHGYQVLVVKALGRIGDPSAMRDLRQLADLTTTPVGIKAEALLACLSSGDRSAAPELAAFLTEGDFLERELRRQPIFPRA